MDKNDYIFGIRPVMEAIEAGKDIDKILVKKDLNGDLINELYDLVKRYRILIQRVPVKKSIELQERIIKEFLRYYRRLLTVT